MKKSISIFAALLLGLTMSTVSFAEEAEKAVTEKIQISENIFINHNYVPGIIGSMDSVIIEKDGNQLPIFESEGRRVENVYETDLDNDGSTEFLVQMDSGGSSGDRDMVLLKLNAEHQYAPVWENTYAGPSVEIKENDGQRSVYIEYITNPKDEKGIKALATLSYGKDGKLVNTEKE